MGLYLADCHLEYARLYLARGAKDKAREHWQIAKDNIDKMGYHRRDKEVQELDEQLNNMSSWGSASCDRRISLIV